MICPICEQVIVETVVNKELSLMLHRLFRHEPLLAGVLSISASVLVGMGVKKLFE
ncbi:MAG: hypothetical protein ACRD1G_11150 [Acidimicrobiales bacterium]